MTAYTLTTGPFALLLTTPATVSGGVDVIDLRRLAQSVFAGREATALGQWRLVTTLPMGQNESSATCPVGQWRAGPYASPSAIPAEQLAVFQTVLASGGDGVARLHFALYEWNVDGTPGALVMDISSRYGTIDLTAAGGVAGRKSIITPGLVLPAGYYILAAGLQGNPSVLPLITSIRGNSAAIPFTEPTNAGSGGWLMTAPTGPAPTTFTIASYAACPIIYAKNPSA